MIFDGLFPWAGGGGEATFTQERYTDREGEWAWPRGMVWRNPSQGGQYYRITPLEEGVAQARGPRICEAPPYAVPLPP